MLRQSLESLRDVIGIHPGASKSREKLRVDLMEEIHQAIRRTLDTSDEREELKQQLTLEALGVNLGLSSGEATLLGAVRKDREKSLRLSIKFGKQLAADLHEKTCPRGNDCEALKPLLIELQDN